MSRAKLTAIASGALILGGMFLPASALYAQSTPASAGNADLAWKSVMNLGHEPVSVNPVTTLVNDADQLRNFYTAFPGHADAKNAKCLEGIALIRAWLAGDTAHDARRNAIVASLRYDKGVDKSLRAELFAFADSAAIEKTTGLSRLDRLASFEASSRSLIKEFPDLPNGYEALVNIAHDSSDTDAPALAREVAGMAGVPDYVKANAQIIIGRFALISQSLATVTANVPGFSDVLTGTSGHPAIIYSWSVTFPASWLRANAVIAAAKADTIVIGLCVDSDVATAKAKAQAEKLPGTQVYDSQGAGGALAKALVMSEPGLVYSVDPNGLITSVSAQNSLVPPSK